MNKRLRTCDPSPALWVLFEFNGSVDRVSFELVGDSQLEVYDWCTFALDLRRHEDVEAFFLVVRVDARVHGFNDEVECLQEQFISALGPTLQTR
jgi:hypothetical protein